MPATNIHHPPTVSSLARDLAPEIASLPRLTALLSGFLSHADDDVAGFEAITQSLLDDAPLTEWILRQANSGLYHQQRPLTSVAEAGVVLGLEALKKLTFAAGSRGLLHVDPFPYPGTRRSGWLHGMAVGCAAAELAAILGPRSPLTPGSARIAGLVHDLGKRLVAPRWPRDLAPPRGVESEWPVVEFDHALASAAVAQTWGLPAPIVESVAAHHDAAPVAGAALLAAANTLMNHWQVGPTVYPQPRDDAPYGRLAALLGVLSPDTADLEQWVESMIPVVQGLDEMLRWSDRPAAPRLTSAPTPASTSTPTAAGSSRRTRSRRRDKPPRGRENRRRR